MATSMKQLNVSITPHFAKFIHGKVKSGRYSNASEVVREALRRFEQEDEIRQQDAVVDPDNAREAVAEAFVSLLVERNVLLLTKEHPSGEALSTS